MDATKEDKSLPEDEGVSRAANHARKQLVSKNVNDKIVITSLLNLFYNASNSVAMIRHCTDVMNRAVDTLNLGHVLVITLDQPLYILALKNAMALASFSRRSTVRFSLQWTTH